MAEVAAGGCAAVRVTASGGALDENQRRQLAATLANMSKQFRKARDEVRHPIC